MRNTEGNLFLQILKAALEGRPAEASQTVTAEQWSHLFELARAHQVLPMILQALHGCPAAQTIPPQLLQSCRQQVRRMVMIQTVKTARFLPLLEQLKQAGAEPLVVKGIICRNLYPHPDQRMSSDEDLLVAPEKMELCHRIMTGQGLVTEDALTAFEVSYKEPGGVLYLEVHQSLFPPHSDAYGDLNRFFTDARRRMVTVDGVPTLGYTDHLFYLICHAFKHFLHSGFGIRQVCDVVMFANRWGNAVDWKRLYENCRAIRAEKFAAAMFQIGEKYLTFDPEKACCPDMWKKITVDEEPMLEDLLDSGVFGSADANRLHSSNMTLGAVEAQKQGREKHGVMRSLFPSAKALAGRYPYLKEHPALLPVAWGSRILTYGREAFRSGADAGESVRIGNKRVELLKEYDIIDR